MEVKWSQVSVQKNTGVKVPSVSHVSQRLSSWRLEKSVEQQRDSFKKGAPQADHSFKDKNFTAHANERD